MNNIMNIEAKITDINRTFHVSIDEDRNTMIIYTKPENPEYDYHLVTESSLLSDIVNELGDVEVEGKIINGSRALELTRNGHFEDVVKGIINSIGKRNLFFTITSLFGKFKKKFKVDISVNRLVKLILSETVDLSKRHMEII